MRYLQDPAGRVYREIDAPAANKLEVVAVISPEDREQVERLTGCLAINGANPNDRNYWQETQAALREFVNPTPPKPDEPQGLGAVVEDSEGRRWVRARDVTTVAHWKRSDGIGDRVPYDRVSVVRVLSEGVQP